MEDRLDIYTDGSSKNDNGVESTAGAAFYIPSLNLLRKKKIRGTNNIAELIAIDYALWYCKEKLNKSFLRIYSDSKYCINILSGKYNYTKNVELIDYIKNKIKTIDVEFEYVKGHDGIEYNEIVDKAAKSVIK